MLITKSQMTNQHKFRERENNFDFLRLIFASFVIITHSYSLSGIKECDWLCQNSDAQITFSNLGVRGFFAISGYLILQSLVRSNSIFEYYWKRFLRLFPALLVVVVITMLLIPFVYEHETVSVIHNSEYWSYLKNNLLFYNQQATIAGVFEKNPFKFVINGSLWTIPYEFSMYILLSSLFYIRSRKILLKYIVIAIFVILYVVNVLMQEQVQYIQLYVISGKPLLHFGLFFIAGALLAATRVEKCKSQIMILTLSLIIGFVSLYFRFYEFIQYLILPIIIIVFATKSIAYINSVGIKLGDLSYGIYIYGFVVQQFLQYYFHFYYLHLMVISLIISFTFAYISWHFIEKPALKYKKLNFFKRGGQRQPSD